MIKKFLGLGFLAAFSAGALASLVALGNRRVDEWETLTTDDAVGGDFVTLSDGTRAHYIARGDATEREPILLIHGLMDSAMHWHKNIDALAQDRRVYAIDQMGFGYSSRVAAPVYSLNYLARAARAFMDELGIARAHIIGHSLGGAVTLQLAHDYPERVGKLIVISPGTYLTNRLAPINLAARVPYAPRALMGFAMTSQQARMRAWQHALGDPARLDPNELTIRVRPMRVQGTANALVAMANSSWANDLQHQLDQITAPTLILWGNKDHTVPVWHAEWHARALPNAQVVYLPGMGHIPQNECPDQVNRLMIDFLNVRRTSEVRRT